LFWTYSYGFSVTPPLFGFRTPVNVSFINYLLKFSLYCLEFSTQIIPPSRLAGLFKYKHIIKSKRSCIDFVKKVNKTIQKNIRPVNRVNT
jgi:hypothetical protein